MVYVRGSVGVGLLCGLFAAACSASPSAGGTGGTGAYGGFGGIGGSAGTGGFAAVGGSAGTGGFAAVGGTGGYGAVGGYGGVYGDTDAGVTCPVGEQCGPTGPDEEGCGTLRLEAEVKEIIEPGNLLVIFDRSGSMDSNWNGTPKYRVAGEALTNALTPLQDSLTVGGVFFPSLEAVAMGMTCDCSNWVNWVGGCCLTRSQNACVVNTIDQPDQISFRPGAGFIAELPNQWRLQGASNTPLQAAVERAAQALSNAVYDGPMSVLIVTDGAPNCGSNAQTVTDQVAQWATEGIKTYVIGLPGAGNAATLLTQLAMVGGTTNYIDPANAADLEVRLRSIVESSVQGGFDSCSITLTPAAAVPEELQLVVVEDGMELQVDRNLGASGGWSVTPDGVNVELTGIFCDNAQAGVYSSLNFKFGCVDLPSLPPPMPPD